MEAVKYVLCVLFHLHQEHATKILLKLSSCISSIVTYAKVQLSWPVCPSSLFLQHGFLKSLGCRTCKRVSWRCCFWFSKNMSVVLPCSYLPCSCTCNPAASLASTQAARPGSWSVRKCYAPLSLPHKKWKFSGVGPYAREILMSFHNCHLYLWTWRFEAQVFFSKLMRSMVIHIFISITTIFLSPIIRIYLSSHLKMP